MDILYEFLGEEPLENVITCMNFKFDKVVYFGYGEVIDAWQKHTKEFLKTYCEIDNTVFRPLSHEDMKRVVEVMRTEIESDRAEGNRIYFDVTGGEDLILVAFGMLSREFDSPIHIYRLPEGKLVVLDDGSAHRIDRELTPRVIPCNLDMMIQMRGCKINYSNVKDHKRIKDAQYEQDVRNIRSISVKYKKFWPNFSNLMDKVLKPDANMDVVCRSGKVLDYLHNEDRCKNLTEPRKLNEILDKLTDAGILMNMVHADGYYRFRYKNEAVREIITDCGSPLELITYLDERDKSDDCMVGVSIDWDGKIHPGKDDDVYNEIDVMTLSGYVMTFISCKSGNLSQDAAKKALYELETVCNRLGGRYAKKVLISDNRLNPISLERAEEMGIEIR